METTLLDEWGLFEELEEKGYKLRVSVQDVRPLSELKEEDVDWVKVGFTAAQEGYSFPINDICWESKS